MDEEFLSLLDEAREEAGVAFNITSGYRCQAYQAELLAKGEAAVSHSAHTLGKAADIYTPFGINRYRIVKAALDVGFNRIGIARTFVHLDTDHSKPAPVIWTYMR